MNMRRVAAVTVLAATLVSTPSAADAKVFEVWGDGMIGGAFGAGNDDRDFFSWASGGATGFEVGARFLFISAYIDYLRFFGGDAGANLLGINLGGDGDIGITDSLSFIFRLAATYYVGSLDSATRTGETGELVSSDAVHTRGLGARGGVGLRYTFLRVLSIGITPEVGYHFMFGGASQDITNFTENSHGWDIRALAYARIGLGL